MNQCVALTQVKNALLNVSYLVVEQEVKHMTLPHILKRIRLELARSKEFPMGSANHGYEFVAPLDDAAPRSGGNRHD
jgi:hypothetical protein